MSTEMTFVGTYYYTDERALRKALSDAKNALERVDSGLAKVVTREWRRFMSAEELSVHVEIALSGPESHFAGLELVVTTLAERADSGAVEGKRGGKGSAEGPIRYPARGEDLE
jgi:hypothetical protein